MNHPQLPAYFSFDIDLTKNYGLLVIDPGNEKSGWALWRYEDMKPDTAPYRSGDHFNAALRALISRLKEDNHVGQVIFEFPVPRGEGVKWQVFATCREVGRMEQILRDTGTTGEPVEIYLADRQDVKLHLCRKATAKDGDVRRAVLERFGGEKIALNKGKCLSCGGKGQTGKGKAKVSCPTCEGRGTVNPGPLAGVSGTDEISAIAIGLCWLDGALPDEAERQRRELEKAQGKAAKALKAAQRLQAKEIARHGITA